MDPNITNILSEAYNTNLIINNNILTVCKNDINIEITFNDNYECKKNNNKIESELLCILLKDKHFNDYVEWLENICQISNEIKNYCISCGKKLDYNSDIFASCGSKKCKYKCEDILIDNDVYDFIIKNKAGCELLIKLTKISFKYDKTIIDPFPPYFINSNNINVERGTLAKLQLKNDFNSYTNNKDFVRFGNVLNNDFKKIFDNIYETPSDNLILNKYGNDLYYFLRFIFKSCKYEITYFNNNTSIYKLVCNEIEEKEFQNQVQKENNESCLLFHGSASKCWYSILRNGLVCLSGTIMMVNGAAYGSGIYMSPSYNFALTYSKKGMLTTSSVLNNKMLIDKSTDNSNLIVGVYEVAGNESKYKKTSTIYVVPEKEKCILRYLIFGDKNSNEKELIDTFYSHKNKYKIVSKSHKKIMYELDKIKKANIYNVELCNNNIFDWLVTYEGVTINIKFSDTFPFTPPFVYIKKPIFTETSKYITNKGALCLEYLTEKHWLPIISIENLIIQVFSTIIDNNEIKKDGEYNYDEASESFKTLTIGNSWY